MCLFSDIKSHPDLPLEKHLAQVAEIAIELLEGKHVEFQSLGLTKEHLKALVKRASLFHDLGKATSYFQMRLTTGKKGPNGEHWHTGLSAILAYEPLLTYCKENNLNEIIALSPLLAILYHHSELSKGLPNDPVIEDRLKAFKKEILNLPILGKAGMDVEINSIKPIEVDCGIENLFSDLSLFSNDQKIEFRLLTLFIYSLLLEADKAYLAVKDKELYQRKVIPIDTDIIDAYKAKEFKNKKANINADREKAYNEVMTELESLDLINHLYSLTLPTGMGKTLLAASWAIKLRNKIQNNLGFVPQIIIALPFLSIIDQSAKEYEKFLGNPNEEVFLKTHSLSSFEFNGYEPNTAEFFVNIWKSQIIMTTFDQLLYTFLSFKPKHLMRFHNLLNSIIIMDEIQALPPHLWHPFSTFIKYITNVGKSYLLVMSATQPRFLDNAEELVPTIRKVTKEKGPERYFEKLSRYKLLLNHKDTLALDDFILKMRDKLSKIEEEKIMIVLNTRDSAKKVYEKLKSIAKNRETYFLSSYIIPAERLNRIEKIKNSKGALVISTQCIEAGIDIDMDYVIRDFGPLDSIIQVAGRCNREGEKETKTVKVIRLYDPDIANNFCPTGEFNAIVYDRLSLDATMGILNKFGSTEVMENEVFDLASQYFIELKRKDLGKNKTECLIDFSHNYLRNGKQRSFDIRTELRGKLKQYNIIVEKHAPGLRNEIEQIFKEDMDRWERRRKLKGLSNKIAMNSISVNAYNFNPDDIAEKGKGNFYFLKSAYYDDEIGFNYQPPSGTVIV
ncbi:MAG: CRISPR-associated helicase/endonuclease Cas3 [Candidatus Jettenia sp.]|uniref:CRISPR-associated protein n=1 Tax=Candidatus Jettenia caeni TaxID=247490 RepID=I3IHL4_9BACT|nr:CRISPR-associated helicase/endonuclease Cas3 [Candidatus Jettenia sp. AMX1]MBC6928523.1 CRISPR-associated helicase/endonuclease Cas3 [Candidatus Jettenia sp.]GAB61209.1 CRISPR-associated protein [Candidatus Jettenia caeni]KAA0251630.1 MAG: CRISPR-associated helicase/endonuclease Cas3 [Candidatus Jettenia sp. AMX1]MCE7879802.1 CRISPR-associated helicase/endonuclease Cas3 [Candidatus Jettenia sp. AMX1]MCQ3925919.1 CRISPR-associated helicase/endonuclease Cas3 [Candidatus Jettenia sp.]